MLSTLSKKVCTAYPLPAICVCQVVSAHKDKKMSGVAAAIMDGADLDRFTRVSEERVGKNLPSHVSVNDIDSGSTSLAASLLNVKK